MNGWNQQFNTYRAKTSAFPWWVTKVPMAAAILILLPAAVLAVAAILVGLLLFFILLMLWRFISAFLPSPVAPQEDPNEGRVNVRVVGREE